MFFIYLFITLEKKSLFLLYTLKRKNNLKNGLCVAVATSNFRHNQRGCQLITTTSQRLKVPEGEGVGSGNVDKGGVVNDRGGNADNGGSVDDGGSWDNGVNEAILVQVLGESLKVDVGEATGSGDVVADEGGQGSADLGGGHGDGEKSRQDDLEWEQDTTDYEAVLVIPMIQFPL